MYQNTVENKTRNKYSLMHNIPEEAWNNIYTIFRSCTKDNKIKELQYKILHRYIPTNKLLFQMGKVPTNKCTFCEMHIETIEHVFFECHVVRNIWFEVEHRLGLVEDMRIVLTVSDVLVGYNINSNNTFSMKNIDINAVLLYVKQYIWECKLAGVKPSSKSMSVSLRNHTMYIPYLTQIAM